MYFFLRPIARIALRTNFKKIYLSNVHHIPKDKPVIFAANHPTAFTEPCVLATCLPRTLNFLVRGDFFKKPIFRMLLESAHMIPIFRLQDGGYSKLKDNYATFEKCFDALKEKKAIMILAEGRTKHEKRLRPIQKGTARIAFGSFEKFGDLDIHIIPVGVNFTNSDQFRSDIMIEMGEPIKIKDYLTTYAEEPSKAIKNLTDDIRDGMAEKIIIIDKDEDIELTENLFTLARNDHSRRILPVLDNNGEPLMHEKKIADHVNQMEEAEKKDLKHLAATYFKKLESHGVTDKGFVQPHHGKSSNIFVLLLGFVGFLIGYIGNFLPLRLAAYIGDTFPKSIEFRHSVKIASGLGLYFVYFVAFIISAIIIGNIAWWIFVLTLPLFGYFSILYKEFYVNWRDARKAQKLPEDTKAKLKKERAQLTISSLIKQ